MATIEAERLVDLGETEFKIAYGTWLRAVRDASGIPRRKVAEYLDSDQGTVRRWEIGANMPDVFTHLRLLDFFSDTLESHPGLKEWATRVYPPAFAPSLSA